MLAQVLIHPEGVERRGIEAGEEHVDDNEHVEFAFLHAVGHIFVVVRELLGGCVEVHAEHGVVVLDRRIEEVTR